MSLEDRAKEIAEWHTQAFPWAGLRDVALKLQEEAGELVAADDCAAIRDELADIAIALFGAAAIAQERLGIKLEAAIMDKFARVKQKYPPR